MNLPVKKNTIFLFSTIICFTVLRFLQLFFCVDSVSGFFKSGYNSAANEITVAIFIFLVFCMFFGLTEKKVPKAFPEKSLSLSIGYLFLSVFLSADLIFIPKTFSPPAWQNVFFLFSGIITIFLFVSQALSYFFEIEFLNKFNIPFYLTLFSLFFWIIRTVICFSFYTQIAIVAELIFIITAMLSIMYLILYISFFVNEFEVVKTSKRILSLFNLTIVSCVNCSVPHILIKIFGFDYKLHNFNINNFTFLGILIFLIILYFNIFNNENLKEKTKKHKKEIKIFKH